MGRPKLDLAGKRFNMLIVKSLHSVVEGHTYWLCKCDCGNEKVILGAKVKNGCNKSCGCLNYKSVHGHTKRNIKNSQTSTYDSWCNMKARCINGNNPAFGEYGGRGIKVCKRWMKFENFLADMGERPDGKTIDRINNDGNYTPSNCRWSTPREQTINRRGKIGGSSRYKGVVKLNSKTWRARIRNNGKLIDLGCFGSEIEAAKAYDKTALQFWGKLAYLNFK